ncbi:MAG: high frequency lysogenization protein HflD [Gammaproteobacteria bacterium]|uniref:High frequency lysogenization protein HflD homolog n=1 Tax=Marinomonas polaris DSM 16579 TaxID=1122206 RepID=A0A1M5I6P7_9GAMM|nr:MULTISPECIES: high frequency lysogenization protein HflD [Marinomonas]MBU1294774.1 high frequency lysogenization protein HflD [Gammaproteobacteria bacterium]MBU1466237.1 high frequency lysogenization protein HflD [Gammaproteobacteria bacterium]MBU2022686.1 high frequency lysogenization protein HflD [Gammaproteobacteria bacterium]MBU2239908.1 high frequency lysogenization protein HflD [Gammaproteobacteria bacterium]MBU2320427.1 high frequency lysogenization protein HflD [Gammaproteobacteria 
MSSREKEQTIALSAIFQAAELVSILAKTGQVDNASLQPLLESLLMVNAASTEDIYGGQWDCSTNLALGRKISRQALGKERSSVNPDTLRYALSLIHLENKLAKTPEMLSTIGQKIAQIEQKKAHYESVLHENMLASISGMYQDTLSKLSFRIQVHGDSRFLQQPQVANQVRAILMSGIRAAMLWRQLGGKRWHLIFKRKALLNALESRH